MLGQVLYWLVGRLIGQSLAASMNGLGHSARDNSPSFRPQHSTDLFFREEPSKS